MPFTTPPAPASSAKVWFCGQLGKSYHFSADVPYTVKQPPIKDLRFKVPDKQFRMYEHDGAYTALPVCFNAAAAVDGVAYVIVSNGSNVFKPYIQSFHSNGATKFFDKKDKPRLYNLEVASLDRKIYIYGIDALVTKSSFEVFDTVNGTFEILPWISKSEDLKFKYMDTVMQRAVFAGNYLRLLGIDGGSKRVVFVGVDGFSFYYTERRKWVSEAVPGFEPRSSLSISSDFGRCVVAGKRIYWLTECKQMMAYDFIECAFYESKALAEFQGTFPIHSELAGLDVVKANLLHINEEYFCLVWQSGFDMGYLFITTLRVSSSTAKKSLTVSLLNTEKYQFDGFHLNMKLAPRLEPTESLLMPDTMELDLEVFAESPAPHHHWDVPYPIVEHLSLTGDRFLSEKALSFWICGYTDEGKRACFFPIDLGVRECAGSREVKRMRHDEILLNPIYFGTGGLYGCVHVALDGKIYNIGGRSIVEIGDRLNPPENCIKVINIEAKDKNIMKVSGSYQMVEGRYRPQVAELDNKIYIFGGDDGGSAEVFDVDGGSCELLPHGFKNGYRLVGVDCRRKRIMFLPKEGFWPVVSRGYVMSYYYYETLTESWVTEKGYNLNHFSEEIRETNRVLVGTTLYWVSENGFHGYDFEKHVYASTYYDLDRDFHYAFNFEYAVSMFHMYEDVYCLVIEDQMHKYGTLYWMAVSISISNTFLKDYGFNKLDLKVLHADLYTIPGDSKFRQRAALRLS